MAPSSRKTNKVVESLMSGDRSQVGGILCNDASGLCLMSEGDVQGPPGIYTNLVRLASQLSPQEEGSTPLITLESESSAIFVKEYDGRAVAIQVPSADKAGARSPDSQTNSAQK